MSDNKDVSASSDDEADDKFKPISKDIENDSLAYSVSDSESNADADADLIDACLDNESSASDFHLYSVVKKSSVVEMVDHHSCSNLIGMSVIMDDLVEVDGSGIVVNDHCEDDELMEDVEANMDWEPLPLRQSPMFTDANAHAHANADLIDAYLDNECSASDFHLYSLVKESSILEMVDHHSCDNLIGMSVIMDDLVEVNSSGVMVNDHCEDDESMEDMEAVMDWEPKAEEDDKLMEDVEANMDWESLFLWQSPRLAALSAQGIIISLASLVFSKVSGAI